MELKRRIHDRATSRATVVSHLFPRVTRVTRRVGRGKRLHYIEVFLAREKRGIINRMMFRALTLGILTERGGEKLNCRALFASSISIRTGIHGL